jgi:hypothetical protein
LHTCEPCRVSDLGLRIFLAHLRTKNVELRPASPHQRLCVWHSARIFRKVAGSRGRGDKIAEMGSHARRLLRADLEDLEDARLIL